LSGLRFEYYSNDPPGILGQWISEFDSFELAETETVAEIKVWTMENIRPESTHRGVKVGSVIRISLSASAGKTKTFEATDPKDSELSGVAVFRENKFEKLVSPPIIRRLVGLASFLADRGLLFALRASSYGRSASRRTMCASCLPSCGTRRPLDTGFWSGAVRTIGDVCGLKDRDVEFLASEKIAGVEIAHDPTPAIVHFVVSHSIDFCDPAHPYAHHVLVSAGGPEYSGTPEGMRLQDERGIERG
jgi:hypothetical protein